MSTPAHTPLRLPAELTIFTASETRSAWLSWMADEAQHGGIDPVCVVEADDVSEVDAAGVQLLVSLANALAAQQRRLQLQGATEALRSACTSLGVHTWLLQDATLDLEAT